MVSNTYAILDSAQANKSRGKRVWLRPGKKYLFGRIRQDGGIHYLFNYTLLDTY
jgi:hypothetical protein